MCTRNKTKRREDSISRDGRDKNRERSNAAVAFVSLGIRGGRTSVSRWRTRKARGFAEGCGVGAEGRRSERTRHNQQKRCRAERRDEPAFINLGRLLNPRFDETRLRTYVCLSSPTEPTYTRTRRVSVRVTMQTAVVLVSR